MFFLDETTTTTESSWVQTVGIIAVYAVIILAFYFIFIRPNKKKQKQEEELKKNIQVGQEIITIGGIVGRVISVRDDDESFVLETAADRTRMRFKKWAISSFVENETEKEKIENDKKLEKEKSDTDKKNEKDKKEEKENDDNK